MDWMTTLHQILLVTQKGVSLLGIIVILSGILISIAQYFYYIFTGQMENQPGKINSIRLNFSRILILGLEFIVAADLIATTTTPDYYSIGIVACIVVIRTVLSFTLSRDISALSKEIIK